MLGWKILILSLIRLQESLKKLSRTDIYWTCQIWSTTPNFNLSKEKIQYLLDLTNLFLKLMLKSRTLQSLRRRVTRIENTYRSLKFEGQVALANLKKSSWLKKFMIDEVVKKSSLCYLERCTQKGVWNPPCPKNWGKAWSQGMYLLTIILLKSCFSWQHLWKFWRSALKFGKGTRHILISSSINKLSRLKHIAWLPAWKVFINRYLRANLKLDALLNVKYVWLLFWAFDLLSS